MHSIKLLIGSRLSGVSSQQYQMLVGNTDSTSLELELYDHVEDVQFDGKRCRGFIGNICVFRSK